MDELTIGIDTETNENVTLSLQALLQGTYVLGLQGFGKTGLFECMIGQLMQVEPKVGLALIDPHGDLIEYLLALVPEERKADVVLLNLHDDTRLFGLNLFACASTAPKDVARTVDQVVHTFKKIWEDSWGVQLEDLLRNLTLLLIENPGYTMAEIPKILTDDSYRQPLVANVTNDVVRHFWEEEYGARAEAGQRMLRQSTGNKIRTFLSVELVRHIVGQATSTVNFRTAMDEGHIVLVRLDAEMEPTTKLLGSVIVGQLLLAALSRSDIPQEHRRRFFLFADEYAYFSTDTFGKLISDARKYGMGTLMAHQYRAQLAPSHQAAPLSVANLITFRIKGEDAKELKEEFAPVPRLEVVGERPKRVPSPHALDTLTERPHGDGPMRQLIANFFGPIVHAAKTLRRDEGMSLSYGGVSYWVTKQDYEKACRLLNAYFLQRMEGHIAPESQEEARAVTAIVTVLRQHWGIGYPHSWSAEVGAALAAHVSCLVRRQPPPLPPPPPDPPSPAQEQLAAYLAKYPKARLMFAQIWKKSGTDDARAHELLQAYYTAYPHRFTHPDDLLTLYQTYLAEEVAQAAPQEERVLPPAQRSLSEELCASGVSAGNLEAMLARLEHCVLVITTVGQMLCHTPITIFSSHMEPDLQLETAARAKTRLSEELVNLPKHQAYCKVLQEDVSTQHRIKTVPPPSRTRASLAPDVERRISWIREHSRMRYGTAVVDVKRQLKERQQHRPAVLQAADEAAVLAMTPSAPAPKTRRKVKLTG